MLIGALVCIRLIVRDIEENVIATRNLSIVENLEPVKAETLAASYAIVFSKELRLLTHHFERKCAFRGKCV